MLIENENNERFITVRCDRLYKDKYVDVKDSVIANAKAEACNIRIYVGDNKADYMTINPEQEPCAVSKEFQSQFASGRSYRLYSYIWKPLNDSVKEHEPISFPNNNFIEIPESDFKWIKEEFDERYLNITVEKIDSEGNFIINKKRLNHQLKTIIDTFNLIINYNENSDS